MCVRARIPACAYAIIVFVYVRLYALAVSCNTATRRRCRSIADRA